MPDCSPVSQWPPVSTLATWETAGKKVEEGGQRCVRRKIWRTTLECTRISNVPKQPQPPAFLPVLLIIRDECHTISISRICHIYMEEMMTQSAFRFHLGCLQKCCWSCPVSRWAASEWAGQAHSTIAKQKVTNLNRTGFFSLNSVLLFSPIEVFVTVQIRQCQRWRHTSLNRSQEPVKLIHVRWLYTEVYEFTLRLLKNTWQTGQCGLLCTFVNAADI